MSDTKGTFDIPGSNGVQDPSMEEILASIRRILSEEQGGSKFLQEPGDELLLDSTMLVSVPNGLTQEPVVKVSFPLPIHNSPPEFERKHEKVDQTQHSKVFAEARDGKQDPHPAAALFQTIESDSTVAIGRPAITLEDMVREALKPMLKSWLDENLPALVERVVRTETNHYPRS